MEGKYEGWTNRDTWAVALYINNDQQLYFARNAARPFTAKSARQFVADNRSFLPARDFSMRRVNWKEIADDFNELALASKPKNAPVR